MKILMISTKGGTLIAPGTVCEDSRGEEWVVDEADQRGRNRVYCTHINGVTKGEFFPSVFGLSLIEEELYKAGIPVN